ncbi:hypothetical protein DPMN_171812 [Dreissena polymorpha]|uniref:Uncharacterized protein n=1 Tax=Dreissena polymorpha TaxID=45954 RepID=A0A9D4BD11_DREPO|nr:hypothetical protein DPMN_190653 [Dreissena polymorpha]KAH3770525.1 hypothetical protein DPMN_171812 [Dreissena polymorpha]
MCDTSVELQDLSNRLYVRARTYVKEVSTEKSNYTVNITTTTIADIIKNGKKFKT